MFRVDGGLRLSKNVGMMPSSEQVRNQLVPEVANRVDDEQPNGFDSAAGEAMARRRLRVRVHGPLMAG
jgi:hypothetical protein